MSPMQEMELNRPHIRQHWNEAMIEDGYTKIYDVDTKKCVYRGQKVSELGSFGRRKFENLLVLSHPKENIKVIYS